jgi:hypothetical protein
VGAQAQPAARSLADLRHETVSKTAIKRRPVPECEMQVQSFASECPVRTQQSNHQSENNNPHVSTVPRRRVPCVRLQSLT